MAKPYIDARLKPNMDRARAAYMQVLSDRQAFAEGEWDAAGRLVGVGLAVSQGFAYAGKSFGQVHVWIGSMAMLDRMIAWWEGRPVMRCLSLQFPERVRKGMYRALAMRGFVREGDMNIMWR